MEKKTSHNIWTDYPSLPLPEVLDFIVDNRGKTVPTAPTGHKLIATNCIRNENLYPSYEKIRYLSEETYQTWFRSHPLPGDIIFVCKGTPGRVCMVPDPIDFCIAQDMVALRVNKEIIYNRYLLVVLRSEEIQKQIYNYSVGDVIPHFKKSFFDQLRIPIPPMNIQRRIGDFYFSFSLKIEINNRINQNLEEQAKAIFKSWFVDFEPFGGKQPDDWKDGTIADLGKVIGGGTPSKAKDEYYSPNGIPWITPKDLSVNKSKFISRGQTDISDAGLNNSSAIIMPKGTVLFSSRAPIGYIAIAKNDVTTNQGFKSVVPHPHIGTPFVYLFLKHNLEKIESVASGSTFKEVSGGVMKSISALIPDNKSLSEFTEQCHALFQKQEALEAENTILQETRDTLLPKLMSDEIPYSEETNV